MRGLLPHIMKKSALAVSIVIILCVVVFGAVNVIASNQAIENIEISISQIEEIRSDEGASYLAVKEAFDSLKENEKKRVKNKADLEEIQVVYEKFVKEKENESRRESQYFEAEQLYRDGNFLESERVFLGLGDYRETQQFLENIRFFKNWNGTWQRDTKGGFYQYIIFNGQIQSIVFSDIYGRESVDPVSQLTPIEGSLSLESEYFVFVLHDDGTLHLQSKVKSDIDYVYEKISSDTKFKKIKEVSSNIQKSEPRIGMTQQEVEDSSWGSPTDINKTTTAYGVYEQWCYSNHKYIYFENGIVTAIQE